MLRATNQATRAPKWRDWHSKVWYVGDRWTGSMTSFFPLERSNVVPKPLGASNGLITRHQCLPKKGPRAALNQQVFSPWIRRVFENSSKAATGSHPRVPSLAASTSAANTDRCGTSRLFSAEIDVGHAGQYAPIMVGALDLMDDGEDRKSPTALDSQ